MIRLKKAIVSSLISLTLAASLVMPFSRAAAVAPTTNFAANVTTGVAPLAVQFTDLSTGVPTSWSWTFGDTGTSTSQSPSHTYNTGGDFNVALTATNGDGSTTTTKNSFIRVIKADFSATPLTGTAPLSVTFTDGSTGTVSTWAWDFQNDGSTDSTVQNPTFSFASAGSYTVKLTISGPAGSTSATKTGYITAFSAPTANFSANVTSGNAAGAGLAVQFTDLSTGAPTSWSWDFGDGSPVVTTQNPSHTYTAGGNFNVALTVNNASLTPNTATKNGFITTIKANFSGAPTSGAVPLAVTFTDSTQGTVSTWAWDFNGDGVVDSTVQSPTYTYNAGGVYTVGLAVTGPGGSSSKSAAGYITANQSPVADFSTDTTSGLAPLTVNFTDLTTGNPTSWAWDFQNDGTTDSTVKNPSFTYAAAGNYSVKLNSTNSAGSNVNLKSNLISVYASPVANFNMAPPTTGVVPLTVQFNDTSTGNPVSYTWNFGDGSAVSTAQNPSHSFAAAGVFTVSLTVSNPVGANTKTTVAGVSVFATPAANFTTDVTSGLAPLAVNFRDTSTGNPTSWAWDFQNDGTADSTAQNPTFTYSSTGTYSVKLTATNAAGSNSNTRSNLISVVVFPTAAFTQDRVGGGAGGAGLTVQFTDQSTGNPTGWSWNFGDGSAVSTSQNPSHTYTTGGSFTVALTVTNVTGSNTVTKTALINTIKAAFGLSPTTGMRPLAVTFTDQSTGTITSWAWDFQNSGFVGSTAQNPSFTYSNAGFYSVSLTVTGPAGTDTVTQMNVINVTAPSPGGGAGGAGTPTPAPTSTPVATATPAATATSVPGTATPVAGTVTPAAATATPVPATATPAGPTPTPAAVLPTVGIPNEENVSAGSQGTDDKGNTVFASGATVKSSQVSGQNFIDLPIGVAVGNTLQSFNDPISGFSVVRVGANLVISMPFKDASGLVQGQIQATTTQINGTGTTARAAVQSLVLSTTEKSVNLTSSDASVGTVSVSLSADLTKMPLGASIGVSVSKSADAGAQAGFNNAAQGAGRTIANTAYSMNITKTNLLNVTDVGGARLTMKVGKDWVDKYGVGNVRGMRYGDDGKFTILETNLIGYEGNQANFQLVSPGGMSVFALTAFTALPQAATPTVVAPPTGDVSYNGALMGTLLLGFMLVLAGGLVLVRSRRPRGY